MKYYRLRVFSKSKYKLITLFILVQLQSYQCEQEILTEMKSSRPNLNLDRLPKAYSDFCDSSCSNSSDSNTKKRCFEHLGCTIELPTYLGPNYPEKIQTTFKMYNRHTNRTPIRIIYDPTEYCIRNETLCQIFPFNLDDLASYRLKKDSRTVIIIPGYLTGDQTEWVESTRFHWLKIEDANIVEVSWSKGNHGLYSKAVANTPIVARQITLLLYYLAQLNDMDLYIEMGPKIYLVGHSLGAHISGFVGQDFFGNIGRITGLDPAGPSFCSMDNNQRLDTSDAKYVDVLHTNSGGLASSLSYGLACPIGHVDYYANDGSRQPGCEGVLSNGVMACSHGRSFHLFMNIIKGISLDIKPLAYYCDNFEDFSNGVCLGRKECLSTDQDLNCSISFNILRLFNETPTTSIPPPPNKLFFITGDAEPYFVDQYLMAIRILNRLQDDGNCLKIKLKYDIDNQTEGQAIDYVLRENFIHVPFTRQPDRSDSPATAYFPTSISLNWFEQRTSWFSYLTWSITPGFIARRAQKDDNSSCSYITGDDLVIEIEVLSLSSKYREFKALYSMEDDWTDTIESNKSELSANKKFEPNSNYTVFFNRIVDRRISDEIERDEQFPSPQVHTETIREPVQEPTEIYAGDFEYVDKDSSFAENESTVKDTVIYSVDTSTSQYDEHEIFDLSISSTISGKTTTTSIVTDKPSEFYQVTVPITNNVKPSENKNNFVVLRQDQGVDCCLERVSMIIFYLITLVLLAGFIVIISVKTNFFEKKTNESRSGNAPRAFLTKTHSSATLIEIASWPNILDTRGLTELSTTTTTFSLVSNIKGSK